MGKPAYIPLEVLILILSWLPVKTLMRFKCVSKSWKSLISDDKDLAKLQLERSRTANNQVILTLRQQSLVSFMPCPVRRLLEEPPPAIIDQDMCVIPPFEEDKPDHHIIGSCNGLLCLYGIRQQQLWFRPWNPATRLTFHKSPLLPCNMDSILNFGFAYDDSRDTYKVVVLFTIYCGPFEGKLVTMVHCIGDSCWREISSVPDFPIEELKQPNGLFVGGCVNWVAYDKLQKVRIVSFDIREETYRVLSLPEGASELPSADIRVLGNCLCLFHDHNGTHFVGWKMREYGVRESWIPLINISYEHHLQCDNTFGFIRWLVCMCGDGDILMLAKDSDWVIKYNRSDNSVKYDQLPNNKLLDADDYVESLVSPFCN